jgi:AmiR/NasT family two-component response regulator
MKIKNKILLVENDLTRAKNLRLALENAGYEITAVVPYIINAINTEDKQIPDVVVLDAYITDHIADFISNYVKLPMIIISDQYEKEIYRYSEKIRILSVIQKPYNIYDIKIPVDIAFNKL